MFTIKYPLNEQKVFLKLIGNLILWHTECGGPFHQHHYLAFIRIRPNTCQKSNLTCKNRMKKPESLVNGSFLHCKSQTKSNQSKKLSLNKLMPIS